MPSKWPRANLLVVIIGVLAGVDPLMVELAVILVLAAILGVGLRAF